MKLNYRPRRDRVMSFLRRYLLVIFCLAIVVGMNIEGNAQLALQQELKEVQQQMLVLSQQYADLAQTVQQFHNVDTHSHA